MTMAYRYLENHLRATPNALRDLWMQLFLWRGSFHCDSQMVMGPVPSSVIGNRLSGTTILILQPRCNYE